ncbi:hypothetical protein D6817_03965 [Candidatus Pacearchaeota archaeon]|nr:MAG: hypothetical protein D6817_03965 [Candidatus Pacearchaeota archaeon]
MVNLKVLGFGIALVLLTASLASASGSWAKGNEVRVFPWYVGGNVVGTDFGMQHIYPYQFYKAPVFRERSHWQGFNYLGQDWRRRSVKVWRYSEADGWRASSARVGVRVEKARVLGKARATQSYLLSPLGFGQRVSGNEGGGWMKGDLNHDGIINFADVSIMQGIYGMSANQSDPDFWSEVGQYADFNDDGTLDLTDLSELLSRVQQ